MVEHEVVELEVAVDVAEAVQLGHCLEYAVEGVDDEVEVGLSIPGVAALGVVA